MLTIMISGQWFEAPRPNPDEEGFHHHSTLLVCPFCKVVWGWILYPSSIPIAETVPCEHCKWHSVHRSGVPGSLLERGVQNRLDLDLLQFLPDALVRREFALTLKAETCSSSSDSQLLADILTSISLVGQVRRVLGFADDL